MEDKGEKVKTGNFKITCFTFILKYIHINR